MKIRINVNRTLKQLFLCALAILLIWTTGCAVLKSSDRYFLGSQDICVFWAYLQFW
jgi:hypothetical protein